MATSQQHADLSLQLVNGVAQAWDAANAAAIADGQQPPGAPSVEVLSAAHVHALLAIVRKLDELGGGAAPTAKLIIPGMTFGHPNGGRP